MPRDAITPERLARAQNHLGHCLLCEHRCGANRLHGERGPCKAGAEARVYRHRVEYGEELELIPSHVFYLSGCDLRCAFCIAEADAFDPRRGQPLTAGFLRQAIGWGRSRGARNLQWVGGEPTVHIPAVLAAMADCPELPPVVWKSDFHGTPEAFELLDKVVDVFVADFKFGNDDCARRIAGVERYVSIVGRNLEWAAGRGDLIVRHLLLPGHFDCCYRPIVDWMQRRLPRAKFSVRGGYLPRWQARHYPELSQVLDPGDFGLASSLAADHGLCVVH